MKQNKYAHLKMDKNLKEIHAVAVPCDQLDKVVIKGNTSTSIKDGGVRITVEVCGDNLQKSKDRKSQ